MTKTFCDRCGKEIKEECGWITHRTLYASIRLIPGKKHAEWSERADLYICPECEVKNSEYVGMIVSGIFAQYHGTRDVKVTIFRLEPASTMRSE